jgi:dTDP-4-dehydrorhamnose 3,5-epimerase
MKLIATAIPDVKLIEPKVFGDARGFFYESWNQQTFNQLGLDADFVQDNHSRSERGVLRGLHYQIQHAQGKLVRVVVGEVYDVAVDLRRTSPISIICLTCTLSIRVAVVTIPDGEMIEGGLPAKKLKLLQAWIYIHEEELMADWALALKGEPVFKIDPLR